MALSPTVPIVLLSCLEALKRGLISRGRGVVNNYRKIAVIYALDTVGQIH